MSVSLQDISEPVMTVDEITRQLETLDAALRIVESEGRNLEESIRKGINVADVSHHVLTLELLLHLHVRHVSAVAKCLLH